jgi:dihydrofolate synthase / folylpolyglutamate synthase
MKRPKTPAEAVKYLTSLSPSTIRLGLDRVHQALAALKAPDTHYPSLQVAGTNGKGSTCAFAASCLRAQGYRVGLYTSPHLERVNERIQINSEPIRDGALGEGVLAVLDAIDEKVDLTFFELGTLVALHHFAQERVDVAVLETGMGGRLDATTAARAAVTAITPVSFDHMDHLGHSLTAIASEKAGIIRPKAPVVVARQAPEVLEVIEKTARNAGSKVYLQGRDFDLEPDKGKFTYRGMRTRVTSLWPGLRGPHQIQNAAVALACLELLEDRGLKITRENARAGLAGTEWPGRLEEIPGTPRVVLDGAHNLAGVETLLTALQAVYPAKALHLVFGVLADKDWRPMIRALFPKCVKVHLAPVNNPRSLDPTAYVEEARRYCTDVTVYESPLEALAAARKAAPADAVVLCAGSLMLVGRVREALL